MSKDNHYDQNIFIVTEMNYRRQLTLTNSSNSFVASVADIRIHQMKSVLYMNKMIKINYFTSKLYFDL